MVTKSADREELVRHSQTLFSDDKPDRFFTVIEFSMDETSGVALALECPIYGNAIYVIRQDFSNRSTGVNPEDCRPNFAAIFFRVALT